MSRQIPKALLLILLSFYANSTIAARSIHVAFSPTHHTMYYSDGAGLKNGISLSCVILNPNANTTAPSQSVTVTPTAVANSANPWADLNIQNNIVSTLPQISFTLGKYQSYEMQWTAANNSAVNLPKGITITVAESVGFLTGNCTLQVTEGAVPIAGSSYHLNGYLFSFKDIAINGGKPF